MFLPFASIKYDAQNNLQDVLLADSSLGTNTDIDIAVSDDGSFVLTWEFEGLGSDGKDIYARIYNSDHNPVGSKFRVNTFTDSNQYDPRIGIDNQGEFVITWEGGGSTERSGIHAQHFSADGTPKFENEFLVNAPSFNIYALCELIAEMT
ncbi:MAG: hypothetical protein AAGA75_07245 [Cyanobacteria bacterium P01_E01_bin.6]